MNQHKCPLCRTKLETTQDGLVSPTPDEDDVPDVPFNLTDLGDSSSKLEAILQILEGDSTLISH